ncbi:MAG: biopolymer transporter ExbD [Planctomycetaceae bacterium]|nr:biopolymer transporter ExbD [Planctomycetaceae bacterium]
MLAPSPGEPADDDVDLVNMIDLMTMLAALLMLLLPTLPGQQRQLVNLPVINVPSPSESPSSGADLVTVQLKADGNILWNDDTVTLAEVTERAKSLDEPRVVRFAGAEDAQYGPSELICHTLHQCGVTIQKVAHLPKGADDAR